MTPAGPFSGDVGHSEAEAGVGGHVRMRSVGQAPHPTHRIAALTMRHPPHEDGGGMKTRDVIASAALSESLSLVGIVA